MWARSLSLCIKHLLSRLVTFVLYFWASMSSISSVCFISSPLSSLYLFWSRSFAWDGVFVRRSSRACRSLLCLNSCLVIACSSRVIRSQTRVSSLLMLASSSMVCCNWVASLHSSSLSLFSSAFKFNYTLVASELFSSSKMKSWFSKYRERIPCAWLMILTATFSFPSSAFSFLSGPPSFFAAVLETAYFYLSTSSSSRRS